MRMLKTATALLAMVALGASWPALAQQQKIKLQVAGNLLATGLIQKNKEQPFFESLAQTTGLPIDVDYKPMDTTGIKDIEGLRVLRNGLFDIVTLRVAQVSRDEPFLLGLDIVGLATDYELARKIAASYREAFDGRLQQRYNAKLLGVLHAQRVDRLVVHVDRQPGALREVLEEGLLLVLLDETGRQRLPDDLERDLLLREGGRGEQRGCCYDCGK